MELAQYEYLLPRLTGMWTHLVRQTASGGSSPIGTRGPARPSWRPTGGTSAARFRSCARSWSRCARCAPCSAGGESAIHARGGHCGLYQRRQEHAAQPLTGSDIPANDRLFDTLDTTTRRLQLDEAQEVLLSDTVGFIRKLPTHLVEAFKATLEELKYADMLLHVIDISSPDMRRR